MKRAGGERVGGIPYGYQLAVDRKHVEEDPAEQAIVDRARELKAEGLSLRAADVPARALFYVRRCRVARPTRTLIAYL